MMFAMFNLCLLIGLAVWGLWSGFARDIPKPDETPLDNGHPDW